MKFFVLFLVGLFVSFSAFGNESNNQQGMNYFLNKNTPKKEEVKKDNNLFMPKDLVRKDVEYPTFHLVKFVESCTMNFIQSSGMQNPYQAKEIGLQMCSCLMDEFRSDFSHQQMVSSGAQIMKKMSSQYSMKCGEKMQKAKTEPTFWVQR